MSSGTMTKIRCPNCRNDGRARVELLNRRVSSKHGRHVFRAVAVADPTVALTNPTRRMPSPTPTPSPTTSPPGDRIRSLEREIRRLRDDLSTGRDQDSQVRRLRDRLARSTAGLGEAKRAIEALRRERDEAVADRDPLLEELDALRSKPETARLSDDRTHLGPSPEIPAIDAPTQAETPAIPPESTPRASEPSTVFDARLDPFEGTEWPAAAEIPAPESR